MPPRLLPDLHVAAYYGSTERTHALLTSGSNIDIDQHDPAGFTALSYAGPTRITRALLRILLDFGANVSVANDVGATALHISAEDGHLATTEVLIEAGAELDPATFTGATPIHLAAYRGRSEVIQALIEAGADVDNVSLVDKTFRQHGDTPLYAAAGPGHLDAVRVLLRAKANLLLVDPGQVPLFLVVVAKGHSEVARELLQELGIDGWLRW